MNETPARIVIRRIGLWAGVLMGIIIWYIPISSELSTFAHATLAIGTLMAIWWITEAIPISATALIPVILFPIFGVGTVAQTTSPYANPVIFLFLGGFILATALERCGLHKRIALSIVSGVGVSPHRLMLGFLLASALLSLWISNTATALMMLPIALSVGAIGSTFNSNTRSMSALLLAVAYGSSIGGLGTLIGTPPNAIMAGYLKQSHDINMGFGEWMYIGVPLVLVCLPVTYFILKWTMGLIKGANEHDVAAEIRVQRSSLGRWSFAEISMLIVFVLTAFSWMFQPLLSKIIPGLTDTGIAITAATMLFILPNGAGGRLMTWNDAERIPWGILLLFGGGLSLADAIQRTELAAWIGNSMSGLEVLPLPVIILVVTLVVIFLTEITSNSATAATFLPIMGALAVAMGYDPRTLVIPAALAASCAFMLPIATPPNAIVYSSGYINQVDMMRAGFWLNLVMACIITAAMMIVGY